MTALPYSDKVLAPLQWGGNTSKITVEAGNYSLSGTIGFKPWKETATFEWMLTTAEALSLINTMKADHFNGTYTFTDPVFGALKLRPVGGYQLKARSTTSKARVSIEFEVL